MHNEADRIAGQVEMRIAEKLKEAFQPVIHLQILNESYMHNVPPGSETHFKVIVVSDRFKNQTLIARHREVNQTLADELSSGVHALSIVAKTGNQWESQSGKPVEPSAAPSRGRITKVIKRSKTQPMQLQSATSCFPSPKQDRTESGCLLYFAHACYAYFFVSPGIRENNSFYEGNTRFQNVLLSSFY